MTANGLRSGPTMEALRESMPTAHERMFRVEELDRAPWFISVPKGYEEVLYAQALAGRTYHEVFFAAGQPGGWRIFFDIEAQIGHRAWTQLMGRVGYYPGWRERANSALASLVEYLRDVTGSRVYVWDASAEMGIGGCISKFSVHIHLPDIGSRKLTTARHFATDVSRSGDHLMTEYCFDLDPIHKNGMLRMPGSPKPDGTRPLLFRADISDAIPTNCPDYMLIWGNYTTCLEDNEIYANIIVPEEDRIEWDPCDNHVATDLELDAIADDVVAQFGLVMSSRAENKGWYRADSSDAWDCPICETTHRDNASVLPIHGGYLLSCRRAKRHDAAKKTVKVALTV